ncbi:MAG TPA: acetyl-CoA carboxylase, carboxyltransferase subunit beta [Candidatus Baltobacteraceae bacterium]|jgi:acetyl-CoA carboxylase carboxyl transferase subunit beta|nr:acetyl-CoA carboxylase, carboxyltransferase subunit beta [Candidatus Baltobacteraceae bacterium]
MMQMPEWLRARRGGNAEKSDAALWMKCPKCGEVLYRRDLAANAFVCPRCSHHFRMGAYDRISTIVDGDFTEIGAEIAAGDPLEWTDKKTYPVKLRGDREKSGLSEAVVCGFGQIGGFDVALGVMDFHFRGGTMGTVVGERLTLLLEEAHKRKVPCIIFTASGGARMEEGMLALMQMAKTTAAVSRFMEDGNFYITVLTDPTTGGVSASFAFQSDVIVAESRAMIGFSGRRVIEQTIRQKLPDQFQTAEFLLEKGQVDMVVDRPALKETLVRLLEYARGGTLRA